MLISMTTTTKMLILTVALTMVLLPSSVYAAGGFQEHEVKEVTSKIGKVSDGTFDENAAQERLEFLMIDQAENGVSHQKEITKIETEYQKLYQMDANLRMEYESLTDILNEQIAIHHSDKSRSDNERYSELPITSVGVSSKTDSIRIGLDKNFVNDSDLPEWDKKIKNMLSNQDVKLTFRIGSAPTLDTHEADRQTTTVDPLKGGASVGFWDNPNNITCTAGYMATENGSGDEGFVSAGHCTQLVGYGQTGIDVHQPVANTSNDIAIVDEEDFSASTYCDCSWNEFNVGESGTPVTMYSLTSDFPVTSQYTVTAASEGLAVYKSGAASGYSVGIIDTWQDTITFPNGDQIKNVVASTYTAQGGDSGGSFMRLNGIAGIHVAHDDDFSYAVTVSRTNAYLGVAPVFSP